MDNALRRQYVDTRFGQSHLYRVEPSQPSQHVPLMCFHMSPWAAVYYEPFLAQIGQDRLSIAVDTPGYGNSDAPANAPEMADYSAAMGDCMDALGLTKVDLMGDRTGAKVALELARQRPHQVRRIILISPVVWTDEERALRQDFPKEVIQKDGSHLTALWKLSVALSMPGRSLEMLAHSFYTRLLQHRTAHLGRQAAAGYNARRALDELDKPIMVLHPKDDLWTLTPRVKAHLRHPASYIHDLPDWGYGFLEVKAAKVADLARAFLDRPLQ